MATYIKNIEQNSVDSHQTSPGYVLTVLRFSNRDTYNYTGESALDVRKPLVIINDALQVSVNNTKQGLTTSMSATLKGGDLNYATALNPGDFILVNMLNWEKDVFRIAKRAARSRQINRYGDGFKGVFKIQTVRKKLSVSPNGVKSLMYTIHAAGFTELNSVMNYNPAVAAESKNQGVDLYQVVVGEFFNNLSKTTASCQDLVQGLFRVLMGKSHKDKSIQVKDFGSTHFQVPNSLGLLLGREMKYATDMINYITGIWGSSTGITSNDLGEGMNQGFKEAKISHKLRSTQSSKNLVGPPQGVVNFYETGTPIQGNKKVYVENWNNNKSWSIIQNNINSTMNEIYTTYRIDKTGSVMPTIITRQKPFTTPHFETPTGFNVTRFFEVPRWRVSSNLLLDSDLGKNESARFNFVQIYTRALAATAPQDHAEQIALGNFQVDEGDIKRSGIRPYIQTANFDFPDFDGVGSQEGVVHRAKPWSEIVSDWIIDGHLKESGSLKFVGIQDPVSVGDNLEHNGIVYHIESVSHTVTMIGDKKQFRTNFQVSYGMDLRSNSFRPVYAEMEHTDAHTNNIEDYDQERILPGISDTQLSLGRDRTDGEELNETRQKSFTLDPKPKFKKLLASNDGSVLKPDKDDGGIA